MSELDEQQAAGSAAVPSKAASAETIGQWNQQIADEFRANGGKVGGVFEGATLALLTTTGAKSGRTLTNPVVYIRHDDGIMLIASNFGRPKNPGWYHNVAAHPEVKVEIGTRTYEVRAVVTEGAERDRLFALAVEAQPAYADYQRGTTRTIPVVTLAVPDDEPSAP